MIRQSLTNDSILEKKFKILRTSIMLGNLKNREETIREYEETAREIDKIKKNVYEELLASKMYMTTTLEDEEKRLKEIITFIENRVKERNDFVDDYIKITSNFLDGLDRVSLEDELSNYKIRYNNILDYMNNCKEIEKYGSKLLELRDELEEKYENKANNEIINSKLEEELIDEFNKFISRNEYYSGLNYTDIDTELSKLDESIDEKKGVLDTFTSSYNALINAGISGAEREEYSSYVQEARLSYYEDIDRKYILNVYKFVLDKQVDYDRLFEKRQNIDNILNDRDKIRNSLDITKRDELEYFASLAREQFSIIKSQKFNMESIDKLILDIADCEKKLEELESANNKDEIVDILREFSVETMDIEKIDMPVEEEIYEEVEKSIVKKPANMVVRIKDPIKINVKSVSDTAKLVMKKVVIVLEPKKFNKKLDKLKEASLELEKEKLENNKDIDNIVDIDDETFNEEEVNIQNDNDDKNVDKDIDVINGNTITEDKILVDDKEMSTDNSANIFLDDDDIGIELDTREVFGDSKVKDVKELNEIKINTDNSSNISIPTEIFIEDAPVEEKIDLFKSTDPFLDDNEFEIEDNKVSDVIKSNMPFIGNIGTVKPNNALSKIEEVVKDNKDVLLPNLGLVDNANKDVPIVSENYIN